jgi:hypothetical protein
MLACVEKRQREFEADCPAYLYSFEVSQTLIVMIYCGRPRSRDMIRGMV